MEPNNPEVAVAGGETNPLAFCRLFQERARSGSAWRSGEAVQSTACRTSKFWTRRQKWGETPLTACGKYAILPELKQATEMIEVIEKPLLLKQGE